MRRAAVALALWFVVPPLPAFSGGQRASDTPTRWWRDPALQQAIKLTTGQIHRLDAIFDRDLAARIALHEKIRRLDSELLRVMADEDEATVMRFIAEVEALRSKQNIRRALMLLEMYRILTPVQRAVLAGIRPPRAFPH
jgi:Spy/CpxP family protein refolding chaperone